jgi:beta-lactamase regulating signal transducer with metallopeptidase domain/peptidoglycan/xylan/chitin deacetylase (PgdA/CDA1 family)
MTIPLLEAIVSHPLAQSTGWALAHSAWQGALVALAFAAANWLLRDASAQARYLAGCAALTLLVALPVTTVLVAGSSRAPAVRIESAPSPNAARGAETSAPAGSVGERLMASVFFDRGVADESTAAPLAGWAGTRFESALPWLALAWASCVALLALRLAGGWARATRLGRARGQDAAREWEHGLARLARRMRVGRAVRLCRSALVEVPTVIGWLRPVILLPAGALAGLTPAQVEALLAHELAHVRRHDYLVNLLQAIVETILFFHPAAWWISGRVRAEREHACDDLAVETTGDVLLYARALAALEEFRQGLRVTELALAANGGSLVKRIQRLIKHQPARAPRRPHAAAALAAIALCCAAVFAHAAVWTQGKNAPRAFAGEASPRPAAAGRRVAVTFVALPMVQTWHQPRAERDTRKLLAALAARNVRAVGFVNTGQLYKDGRVDEGRVGLLRMWLDAGHELGSEGYAHPNLFRVPIEEYKRDILRGEELTGRMARERGARLRYFSYPYLNVGPDPATKEAFERWIGGRGMQVHKVTIDNWDWLYGRVYAEARRAEDEARMSRVADEYVAYMERTFEFYEQLSRDTLGYEPPQVLMLTANGLNCQKAEDLLAMLERRGYSFVTLEEAMSERAYQLPDTYTGEWGISWLQRWAMARGAEFRKEPYLSDWMAQFHADPKKGKPNDKSRK